MKKICILICILLCCGCKAKYEINFNGNKINDKLSVSYSKDEEILRPYAPDPLYAVDNNPYNLKSNTKGDYTDLKYTYTFNIEQYSKAFIPSSCFSSYNFLETDDKYYFLIDGEFLCSHIAFNYFDSLDIVISTNHVVIDDNADEKKNGKYIWHVSPDDEELSLRLITSKAVKKSHSLLYLFGGLSLFVVGLIFVAINKNRSRNEI